MAHSDQAASSASKMIGAQAFTIGNHVAFASAPSLHTVAHEAAHTVQQRGGVQLLGGVGAAGDRYERHADAVADVVLRGGSAESLLDQYAGGDAAGGDSVQRSAGEGSAVQLKGEYAGLPPDKKDDVDKKAVENYKMRAELFEVNMPAIINQHPSVTTVVDKMLAKVKTIFEAWATATDQLTITSAIKDSAYKRAFKFAGGDRYFGSFRMRAEDIRKVFTDASQPLRKKLKVVYNAVRNNNLSMWLKLAAAEMMNIKKGITDAVEYQSRVDTAWDVDATTKAQTRKADDEWTSVSVKQGFAKASGLDTVLSANSDAKLKSLDAINQKEKMYLAPDMFSDALGWAPDTVAASQDRERNTSGKVHALQHRDVPDLTMAEIHQIQKNRGDWTYSHGSKRKKAFKSRPDEFIPWEQGGDYYQIKKGSQLEKDAEEFKARLVAGVSGSTDLMLHAAQQLGMSDADLKSLRLAMLGWMLLNRDHSFYEIMRAAASYGLPFAIDKANPGLEYETAGNFDPMDPALLLPILGGIYPRYFLSEPFKDFITIHHYATDTIVTTGIPRHMLEGLPQQLVVALHYLDNLVASTAFDSTKPVQNATAMGVLEASAQYKELATGVGGTNAGLMLACLVRHRHTAAVLAERDQAYVAAADVLKAHADATKAGPSTKIMQKAELDALSAPKGFTKPKDDFFQIETAKKRLKPNIDAAAQLKKLLLRKDQAALLDQTHASLLAKLEVKFLGQEDVLQPLRAMPKPELIEYYLDEVTAKEKLPAELAEKIAAFEGLHDKEAGAIFKYTTSQYIPIIESLCSLHAGDFDAEAGKAAPLDWGKTPLSTLQYTAPMIKALTSGLSKLPVWKKPPVFRGAESHADVKAMSSVARQQWAAKQNYVVGRVMTQPFPMSTSKTIDASFFVKKAGFDIGWQIDEVKTGVDIQWLSNSPEEEEVLFPPGARLEITAIDTTHDKGILIKLKEV